MHCGSSTQTFGSCRPPLYSVPPWFQTSLRTIWFTTDAHQTRHDE